MNLRQCPLGVIFTIFGCSFLIFFWSLQKRMKNGTTFSRMCSSYHLGDSKRSIKDTPRRRIQVCYALECKISRRFVPNWACLPSFCFGCIFLGLGSLHCLLPLPPLPTDHSVINTYFLMLNKLGVLAFSLTADCQVTGNPIPSTQHGSRVVEGFSGHLRCTPVLGRLRRTPNSRWFPGSPTPYGAHPAPLPVLSCQPYPVHSQPRMRSIPHNPCSLCIVSDVNPSPNFAHLCTMPVVKKNYWRFFNICSKI